jgi:crotonobetaine/carnitine-CoA ligase
MKVMVDTFVRNKNVNELWEDRFRDDKDKLFLVFESTDNKIEKYTYGELYRKIIKTANFFLDLGVAKGDRVAVQLFSSPEFIFTWFGLLQIGAVLVPMNIHNKSNECKYIMDKSEASFLVIEEAFLEIHKELNYDVKKKVIARTDNSFEGYFNLSTELEKQPEELKEVREIMPDDLAEILFTSGTTSMPKGAKFTHYNLLFAGQFHASQMKMTSDDTFFTVFPCFHIDWQAMAIMPTITKGASVIVNEKYHATSFWEKVRGYKATIVETIPMLVRTLMLQPEEENEKNHKVRLVYFSLCMSTEEKEAFEERFKVKLFNCYGMTETVVCNTADVCDGEAKWPSVGKIYDPYEIKIVDDKNNTLPPEKIGEICLKGERGKNLISGYYNNEEATAKLYDSDDWLHTGDKGYLDEEGWLYFVDRNNNLIKRSGENISASEVENVLTSHEYIDEAAVVGVPDPIREEAVKAYIKFVPEHTMTVEEIEKFCLEHLASYKVPTIIKIVNDFAHTCTGKIQKKSLQQSD